MKGKNNIFDLIVEPFIDKVEKFFIENPIILNNQQILLRRHKREGYATIYEQNNTKIYFRIDRYGNLNDIGIYFQGGNVARILFDRYYLYRNKIEKYMGYKLVWQREGVKGENSSISRISKFGPKSINKFANKSNVERYDFNLDLKQIVEELVKFYKLLILDEIGIMENGDMN